MSESVKLLRLVSTLDPAALPPAELLALAERLGVMASNAAEEATGVPAACRRAQSHPDWSTDHAEQRSLVLHLHARLMRSADHLPVRVVVARLVIRLGGGSPAAAAMEDRSS